MTHKSLFKEAAQRIVQLGQMSDPPPQSGGQTTGTRVPAIHGGGQARAMTYPDGAAASQQSVLDSLNGDR
jgi:hypothetical protein